MTANSRFLFGENWLRFLESIDERTIENAIRGLQSAIGTSDLSGVRFLDIGCGSGLSSLAAVRRGASVHSFDYDRQSVECSRRLKQRLAPHANWTVEQGSALDADYLRSLGQFDIVYSWGVLHHTGDMWKALDLATIPLAPEGRLMVAIYNDQGVVSNKWATLKRRYNEGGWFARKRAESITFYDGWGQYFLRDLAKLKLTRTLKQWRQYSAERGMSPWIDIVDWAGGYPFEVAKPEAIFDFYRARGFTLKRLKTCGGGKGCNEFLFSSPALESASMNRS